MMQLNIWGLLFFIVYLRQHCYICCPDGYSFCNNEDLYCNKTSLIAYGSDKTNTWAYQISNTGSLLCNNDIFGDSSNGDEKECCYQNPILSGPTGLQPVVRSIKCGDTIRGYFDSKNKPHFYQLTTHTIYDITLNDCNTSFDSTLTVYNSRGVAVSLSYCSDTVSSNGYGDDCDIGNVCGSTTKQVFTMDNQKEDTYYIRIAYFDTASTKYDGIYIFSVNCDGTNYPTAIPTTMPSDPTQNPTMEPTINPTLFPTINPTLFPTIDPTIMPSKLPTKKPSHRIIIKPIRPTKKPTKRPTIKGGGIGGNPSIEVTESKRTEETQTLEDNKTEDKSNNSLLNEIFGEYMHEIVIGLSVFILLCSMGCIYLCIKRIVLKKKIATLQNGTATTVKAETPDAPDTDENDIISDGPDYLDIVTADLPVSPAITPGQIGYDEDNISNIDQQAVHVKQMSSLFSLDNGLNDQHIKSASTPHVYFNDNNSDANGIFIASSSLLIDNTITPGNNKKNGHYSGLPSIQLSSPSYASNHLPAAGAGGEDYNNNINYLHKQQLFANLDANNQDISSDNEDDDMYDSQTNNNVIYLDDDGNHDENVNYGTTTGGNDGNHANDVNNDKDNDNDDDIYDEPIVAIKPTTPGNDSDIDIVNDEKDNAEQEEQQNFQQNVNSDDNQVKNSDKDQDQNTTDVNGNVNNDQAKDNINTNDDNDK